MKKIAIYLRLSMADADMEDEGSDESNSIENQRLLIHEFLKSRDDLIGDVIEYVDDGYSGLNFNRPGFRQMIEDAKSGLIGTIIVKDLSRFGRDYIGTGDYLEQILPALQVRLIAINSHYDSKDRSADILSIDVGIQNIINNMYSKDLSRKISGAFRAKWEAGENPSGHVAYGYYIDENHKIQINEETAPVVRKIFDMAADGFSTLEIAERLNSQGFLSPLMYKLKKTGRKVPKNIRNVSEQLWCTRSVISVIRNIDYTGVRVHGKKERYLVGQRKTRNAPKDRRIIVENDHPAIVSKDLFSSAQMAIKWHSSPKGWNSYEDAFSKKIRCGCCGNLLQLTGENRTELYCAHSKDIGSKSKCNKDSFDRRKIVSTIIYALKNNIDTLSELNSILIKQNSAMFCGSRGANNDIEGRVQSISDELARKYEDLVNGRITRDMFVEIKNKLNAQRDTLLSQKKEDDALQSSAENTAFELSRMVNIGQALLDPKRITSEIVDVFLDEVFVYSQDKIDIHLRTADLYERTLLEIQKTNPPK